MRSTDRLPFKQWADVHRTDRFICVEPLSGYRQALREDEGYIIYLAPDTVDEALGRALLGALNKSRFIWPGDEPDFFEAERYVPCYRNWQKDFMQRYRYKTKRDAYRNMNWCRAERSEGALSIQPHRRDNKPEYWWDLPADSTVVISALSGPEATGAALRLALDRCE